MFKKAKTLLLGALVLPAMFAVGCGDDHTHTLTKTDAVANTCTTAGNSAYYTCECGEYFSDAEGKNAIEKDSWILSATGHIDENEDSICDTCRNGEAVRIGDNSYASLPAAYAAANSGATIKLMADIDLETAITVDKNITIDLNGKTVTAVNDTEGNGLFMVVGTATLTINGDGILNSATQANPWGMAIFAKETSRVVINGGTFTNKGTCHVDYDEHGNPVKCNNEVIYARDNAVITINGGNYVGAKGNSELIYASGNGQIIINGGSFEALEKAADLGGDEYALLNCYDAHYKAGTANITVKGGKYKDFNPANNTSEGPNTNFVAEGYTSTQDGEYWVVSK